MEILPQRRIEHFQEAVGKAEIGQAEAGRVSGEGDPAVVVDIGPDRGDAGRGHLLHEPLGAGAVEAVDRLPLVLLGTEFHRLHVLVPMLADLHKKNIKSTLYTTPTLYFHTTRSTFLLNFASTRYVTSKPFSLMPTLWSLMKLIQVAMTSSGVEGPKS